MTESKQDGKFVGGEGVRTLTASDIAELVGGTLTGNGAAEVRAMAPLGAPHTCGSPCVARSAPMCVAVFVRMVVALLIAPLAALFIALPGQTAHQSPDERQGPAAISTRPAGMPARSAVTRAGRD